MRVLHQLSVITRFGSATVVLVSFRSANTCRIPFRTRTSVYIFQMEPTRYRVDARVRSWCRGILVLIVKVRGVQFLNHLVLGTLKFHLYLNVFAELQIRLARVIIEKAKGRVSPIASFNHNKEQRRADKSLVRKSQRTNQIK